jgi:peptidoglycan/LPS O-acetylase OafA/YrhL
MTATARAPFVTKAPKLGLVPSFDGLRGMGVAMLLVGHALFSYVESWVTIIDAFFVLSGFLITTLLIQEHRSTGTIDLKKFYQRRGLRLLPSVFLFVGVWLVISTIATIVGYEKLSLRYVGADAAAAVTYTYHLFFPNGLYIIEPAVQSHRTMWHLWTLSVEEWFYIGIAGTVLVCLKRHRIALLGMIMGALFVAIGIARWYAFTGFWQDDEGMVAGIRMLFIQRPDSLMLGVAIACMNAYLTQERLDRIRRPMLALGTFGLVVWFIMLNLSSGFIEKLGGPYFDYLPTKPSEFTRPQMMETMYWFRFGHTLGALAFATVLICLCRYRTWWPTKFWNLQPLQWMGRLSYTLYIWHALPYLFVFALTGGENTSTLVTFGRVPILIASAFLVSMPVYYHVELRVLKAKLKFSAEKEALDLTTGKMVRVDQGGAGKPSADGDSGDVTGGPSADPGSEREGAPGGPGAPVG